MRLPCATLAAALLLLGIPAQSPTIHVRDFVPPAGRITGKLTDDRGEPWPGCQFNFPLQDLGRYPRFPGSEADGSFDLDRGRLSSDEQLLRVSLSYGAGDCPVLWRLGPGDEKARYIWHEKFVTLDRESGMRLDIALPRGRALRINLPPGEGRRRLLETHARGGNDPDWVRRTPVDSELYLTSVALAACEPNSHGFRYHQWRSDLNGVSLQNEDSVSLPLEHVPPGKHALRLEAALFAPGGEWLDLRPSPFPIALLEFEMPDGDHEISVELSPIVLDFQISVPANDPWAATFRSPPVLILNRLEAFSPSLGKLSLGLPPPSGAAAGFPAGLPLAPMVSWLRVTGRAWWDRGKGAMWEVTDFSVAAVPPGRYAARLFPTRFASSYPEGEALTYQEFEVPPGAGRLSIDLAWPAPKPGNF